MGAIQSRIRPGFSLVAILIILIIPILHAEDYYADLDITVNSSGYVTIQGISNFANLTVVNSPGYTSKNQQYWTLNITKKEIFAEYLYKVTLPPGSSINYFKSTGLISIREDQGSLMVTGMGENETLSIIIQYQIDNTSQAFLAQNSIPIILFLAIAIVSILIVVLLIKEKKQNSKNPPGEEIKGKAEEVKVTYPGLNERQQQIIMILQKANHPLTQTDLQRELQIPKASVSRNLHSLERKGLIEKEQIGMSKLVRLKK
jgi:uncharacterized membrane protein